MHLEKSLEEVLPVGQSEQVAVPVELANLPLGQKVQEAALALENFPAPQSWHEPLPLNWLYFPLAPAERLV